MVIALTKNERNISVKILEDNTPAPDIYFDRNFPELYERIEDGITTVYSFECEYGKIEHVFLKRRVPVLVKGVRYYDAITAYGYGGPIVRATYAAEGISAEETKKKLIDAFQSDYKNFCEKNKIISEFIRFHPIFGNADDFSGVFSTEYIRNTVGTNLIKYPDFFQEEYEKSCRKNIKQAFKKGVTIEVEENPDSLTEFKKIYYSTMDRNHAAEYYYFDDMYFQKCL